MKDFFKKILVQFLEWESRAILKKYSPHIVAIAGSVGKTITKDAIFTVFEKKFYTRCSEKSYNSEFGAPLTIIGQKNPWDNVWGWCKVLFDGLHLLIFSVDYPKWLILETGVGMPGDMKHLARMIRPDQVIMTGMGKIPVHVEFFDSPEAVWEEKKGIIRNLKPNSTIILNNDSPFVASLKDELHSHHIIKYGFSDESDVKVSQFHIIYRDNSDIPLGIA